MTRHTTMPVRAGAPLNVFVIDMDWHKTFDEVWWKAQKDQAGETKSWAGYSCNRLRFPDPEQFLKDLHAMGLKVTLNLHRASGTQPWEDAYRAMARATGIDAARGQYVAFDITNEKFPTNYLDLAHGPLEKQRIDFWWLNWQQHATTTERRLWAYPEPYSDIMRRLFHERYAMLPYIYTEARPAYDTGVGFLHPLYCDWLEADEAYATKNEYVFGSQMIVSPMGAKQ